MSQASNTGVASNTEFTVNTENEADMTQIKIKIIMKQLEYILNSNMFLLFV